MPDQIIVKLKKNKLIGRGGACFPVWEKWSAVKKYAAAQARKPGRCYVACNASEGEPDVKKDRYILENYPETMVRGMNAAIQFLGAKKAYLYLNPKYYIELAPKLKSVIGALPIEVIEKPHGAGYIGGEESSLLSAIEGKRVEPRLKPPYPVQNGLFGYPTLTNNVETFYDVGRTIEGTYKPTRFITITEHNHPSSFSSMFSLKKPSGNDVYSFPADWTIEKILKQTNRYPLYKFFVQVGGGASGEVVSENQLKRPLSGSGSISLYKLEGHNPLALITHWINFFFEESCGQCTPCREGIYRIKEELMSQKPDWGVIKEILDVLTDSAFCGLGCALPVPIESYVKNILPLLPENHISLTLEERKTICECFS